MVSRIDPTVGVPGLLRFIARDLRRAEVSQRFLETGDLDELALSLRSEVTSGRFVTKGSSPGESCIDRCYLGPNSVDFDVGKEVCDREGDGIPKLISALLVAPLVNILGEPNTIRLFVHLIGCALGDPRGSPIESLIVRRELTKSFGSFGSSRARDGFYRNVGFNTKRFSKIPYTELASQIKDLRGGIDRRSLSRIYCRYMDKARAEYEIDPEEIVVLARSICRSPNDRKITVELSLNALRFRLASQGFDFPRLPCFRRETAGILCSQEESYPRCATERDSKIDPRSFQEPPFHRDRLPQDEDTLFWPEEDDWIPKGIKTGYSARIDDVVERYKEAEILLGKVSILLVCDKASLLAETMEHCSREIVGWFGGPSCIDLTALIDFLRRDKETSLDEEGSLRYRIFSDALVKVVLSSLGDEKIRELVAHWALFGQNLCHDLSRQIFVSVLEVSPQIGRKLAVAVLSQGSLTVPSEATIIDPTDKEKIAWYFKEHDRYLPRFR